MQTKTCLQNIVLLGTEEGTVSCSQSRKYNQGTKQFLKLLKPFYI